MAVSKLDVIEQYFDNNGNVLAGGLLYTYAAGTTTPLATYTDSTGGTPNANPVVLDSGGRAEVWFTQATGYKVIAKTSAGVTLETVDGIIAPSTAAAAGSLYADVLFFYAGGPPATSELIYTERFTRAVNFTANWTGSFGRSPVTNAAATFIVTIKKNNSTVGTASCSTGGTWTFATSGGAAVAFAAGDVIDFAGPAVADTNLANFALSLAGTLA